MAGELTLFARLARLGNGEQPYPHQLKVFDCLRDGKPVLLLAPTGAGKSEAVFVPFLAFRGNSLPPRLIYSLPARTLVNSLANRFRVLAEGYSPNLRVCSQHGEKPESVLFYADAVVATLDQVVSSYACAPLSLGVRHGNIPAGAVASGFIVLDEVHTFDPERGLQSALIIVERLDKMEMPFVIMTATLPQLVVDELKKRFPRMEIVVAQDKDIPSRAQRRLIFKFSDVLMTPETVLELHSQKRGRTIVVCNTVSRALRIYEGLNGQAPVRPLLVHSRFVSKDREEKERKINSAFGKASETKEAILVTTQVVEVGLDISADLLLTELSPIDSLIQRMGRCARWLRPKEQNLAGETVVFAIEAPAPYHEELVNSTKNALKNMSGQQLDWDKERSLVDKVLGEHYKRFLNTGMACKAMTYIAQAAFYGDRKSASAAVRDNDSVEIAIHSQPKQLGKNVWYLPRISLSQGTLRHFIGQHMPDLWRIETQVKGDDTDDPNFIPVNQNTPVMAGDFFIISSQHAQYSTERGLVLGEMGADMTPNSPMQAEKLAHEHQVETWEQHAATTMKCFEEILVHKEGYVLKPLADWLNLSCNDLLIMLKIALLGHDLGKLAKEWQRSAWSDFRKWAKEPSNVEKLDEKGKEVLKNGKAFLARFPAPEEGEKSVRPAHATVSAYLLGPYFKERWNNFGIAAALAIAHHHAVRAQQVPKYTMKDGWQNVVGNVFTRYGLNIPLDKFYHL